MEQPQGTKRKDLHPDAALALLRTHLSGKKLSYLLRLCAGLSCHDTFVEFSDPWSLKQFVNYLHNRALSFAVLQSNSTLESGAKISREELIWILNNVYDASHDAEALEKAEELNGKKGVELELLRFICRMGNTQIAHKDEYSPVSAGRSRALIEILPVTKRHWLSDDSKRLVDKLAPEFSKILGGSIEQLWRAHVGLIVFHRKTFELAQARLQSSAESALITEEQRLFLLLDLILLFSSEQAPFDFSMSEVVIGQENFVNEDYLERYVQLCARPIQVHRDLMQRVQYQIGHIAWRLCPLERYPIVELKTGKFVIPNLTFFNKSLPHVIDYTLLDRFQDAGNAADYGKFRGVMQEVYLRTLVEDCLPTVVCIPERSYGKEEKKGPDLTIVETETRRLIVIESKSRRMLADTVALMTDEAIETNLEDVFSALLKAPKKVEALYAGIPAYSDVQGNIDRTKPHVPFVVVVLSNTVFALTEVVRLQSRGNPNHPLKNYPYPFCIVSLETFERAVELAKLGGLPLSQLLDEHWEVSGAKNFSAVHADRFKGRELPNDGTRYATKYLMT